jgi:adenosylcobinamide-phosphate synthase
MGNFLAVAIAIFLDRLFGELPIYHPLKGFTRFATYIEDQWHRQDAISKHTPHKTQDQQPEQVQEANPVSEAKSEKAANQAAEMALKVKGASAAIFLIIPFVALAGIFSQSLPTPLNFVFNTFVLYLAIGAHNLKQHAFDVQKALISENLEIARKNLATIVNRDTLHMDRQEIISTCIESIVENGCEMILAPIFWFLIMSAPGVVLYALVHSLNNMWGYQSPHYKNFGWAVGKANEILNWIPSRMTAFSYILLGDMKNGWACLNAQAKNWNSPNAELVVATGAGALHLEIGGDLYYQGQLKIRPKLGQGKMPDLSDIARASDLVERSMVLWLAFTLVISIGH